jgi:hypothetical protein
MSLSNILLIPGMDGLTIPNGLGFNPGISFYRNGTTSFHKSNYILPTDDEIWISTTGNDTTGNGTEGTPYRTFGKAFTEAALKVADTVTIKVGPGLYNRQSSWTTTPPSKNLNIIAYNGEAIVSKRYEALSWSVHSGTTYVATRSAVNHVRDDADQDANGVAARLTLAADLATCIATPGSYFISGSILYVNLIDGRAPDSNVLVMGALGSAQGKEDFSYYCEGLTFEGGTAGALYLPSTTPVAAVATFVDCNFRYGVINGLRSVGVPRINCHNCDAYASDQDGFNYQQGSGDPRIVEIDCRGFSNGIADNNDNGSALHGTCRGIRFNCEYFANRGPNVVDVDSSKSWNYLVTAQNSTATSNPTAFLASGNAANEMWVEECTANDTTALNGASSSTLYSRNNTITGTVTGNVVAF